jgi:hypothetical protein
MSKSDSSSKKPNGDSKKGSVPEEIAYLDFDLEPEFDVKPKNDGSFNDLRIDKETQISDFADSLNNVTTSKSSCIVTSINDLGVLVALLVVNQINAVVMPSGVFGTVAFLKDRENDAPNEAAKKLTLKVQDLEVILVEFKMGRIESTVYSKGKKGDNVPPTLVVGNFSEAAEDALIGELDLFKLVETGDAKVDAQHALAALPSNYIPKKYQKGYNRNISTANFNAFPTFAMPMNVAIETLRKFEMK